MTTQDSLNTFDFLAHPPPRAQTSAPRPPTHTAQTISRHRSNTVTAISAWVAGILPGSPPPASPPASSAFSRRPSLIGIPRAARQHSRSLISFADTPDPSLRTPEYAYTVVPLPIPPHPSAPSRSSSRTTREYVSGPDEMKFSPLLAMRLRKTPTQAMSDSRSPTLPKKKGFMHFLHLQRRSRSVRARKELPLPSCSPTTLAFHIAHQKRTLYAQCGALPLPLESEVAVMQFMDGGSRADAAARLGGTYKDEAGVIYTDEAEARECLPLLLPVESDGDDADLFGLPSTRSGLSEGFIVPSLPPSPLTQTSLPPLGPVQQPPTPKLAAASSPLALLSVPARGGCASVPGYLHTAPPSLPVPFGGLNLKAQLTPPVETNTSRRKRRRRPAPLTLHLPAHGMGFEDSFAPCVVVEAPSPTAR
jgi:hypothetical protein